MRGSALPGPDVERPLGAERDDRDQRVVEVAQLAVAVEGDAVTSVAVVVEPGSAQRPAVAGFELGPDGLEGGMRHRIAAPEPAGEPGVVDHPVVHPAPTLPPFDPVDQGVEQRVGAVQPGSRHVDPRLLVELDPLERDRPIHDRIPDPEQRPLMHAPTIPPTNRCSPAPATVGGVSRGDGNALRYFAEPGVMTDGGRHASALAALPADVPALAAVAQGLLIHEYLAEFYGVTLSEDDRASVHVRRVAELLDRVPDRDGRPLADARPPAQRVPGNCRHFTVLLVAMLRAHAIPARARCGFGSYFVTGRFEDHWVCEYWNEEEQRWVLVDAQIDAGQREAFPIDFDVTDVPRDRFIIAGDAWAACRAGDADPDTFGLTMVNEAGAWWIASNLMRDAAALCNLELLPWDDWGVMPGPDDTIEGELQDLFDRLAEVTYEPDVTLPELHELQQTDARVRVPGAVRNFRTGRDEIL